MENVEFLSKEVYYVECENDDTVLVAVRPRIQTDAGRQYFAWYDTCHERMMRAIDIKNEDGIISFMRDDAGGNRAYRFTPMTLEIYNDKVKKKLIAGRDFDNINQLLEAFIDTTNYGY